MDKSQYPIRKKDNLGRLIYVDWNGIERVVYKYWAATDKVKVKYRLFNQETSFDAYNITGANILSYSSGSFEVNLPRLKFNENGELVFMIERSRLLKWKNIIKPSKRKVNKLIKLTDFVTFNH